ncbi:hypothetical protein [Candidatus Phytoplasma meliae]|uniref:Uncharacterized protein n=1 Tax=Candidatus Phytoplasma meliae TaxID=1848402 RepID=A0ABS5CZ29_9MOLU|nr:hypothetical protein [Candidatus Phytoplasma meliae]MBP5836232.1 hypothetical protein [Candidatus Phytoplasma meliae]
MNKIIKKKTKSNINKKIANKENLTIIEPIKEKAIDIPNKNKPHRLKTLVYLTIICHFILYTNVLYYNNKIPWFTTGINNCLELIKSIGGQK